VTVLIAGRGQEALLNNAIDWNKEDSETSLELTV